MVSYEINTFFLSCLNIDRTATGSLPQLEICPHWLRFRVNLHPGLRSPLAVLFWTLWMWVLSRAGCHGDPQPPDESLLDGRFVFFSRRSSPLWQHTSLSPCDCRCVDVSVSIRFCQLVDGTEWPLFNLNGMFVDGKVITVNICIMVICLLQI